MELLQHSQTTTHFREKHNFIEIANKSWIKKNVLRNSKSSQIYQKAFLNTERLMPFGQSKLQFNDIIFSVPQNVL